MSRRFKSICISMLTGILVLSVAIPPAMASGLTGPLTPGIGNVMEGSQEQAPRMLQGKLSGELRTDSDVIQYFSTNQQSLRQSQAQTSLTIAKKISDAQGRQHYMLQQQYRGLPVYGKYITAHVGTDKRMYAITNDASTELEGIKLDTQPTIDENQAAAAFQSDVEQAVGYAITLGGQLASRELGKPKAQLMVYPSNGTYSLAYKVDMEYMQPKLGRWIGFVDANTGIVLKKFSRLEQSAPNDSTSGWGRGYYGETRALNLALQGSEYYLSDKTKPMYHMENGIETGVIETYDAENPFFPVNSPSPSFDDPEAVDAHYFAGQVYDFYASRFNRNSLDGNGMSIISVVNAGAIDNAYWDGYEIVYGDGNELFECLTCANDVIAHELTHAVTEYTANLEYSGQSGALNESISDIMAVVYDDQDWSIAENAGVAGGSGVLRDLEHPERGIPPQPSTMAGYENLPEDIDHDNGGVHMNSGIPNHAAYLIAKGIDALPALTGQGRSILGDITYMALTSYLTPTSGFIEARDSFVLAANDLTLPEEQKNAVIEVVKAAWATVGLPYSNNENGIVSFSAAGMVGNPDINALAHTVTFSTAYGTNLTALAPQIAISPGASITPDIHVAQDFTNPVAYTVTSQNGQSQTWMIQGSVADPQADRNIVGFNSDVLTGPAIIDPIQHTVTLYVEKIDNVSAIQPTVEVSAGAKVSPASGSAVNLNRPVTYTVTAENGTVQTWTVTAIKDSDSPKVLGGYAENNTTVAVVFDQAMSLSALGNIANYKLESLISGYSNPQISKVEVDCDYDNVVYLTTSALVSKNGYKITVSGLKGTNGRSVRPDATNGYFLMDDTVQPVLSTARINGNQLTLTYNEPLKNAYGAVRDTFHVEVNNRSVMLYEITSVGRKIILTLDNKVTSTDRVTISHTPVSTVAQVTDFSGNNISAFNKLEVINRTGITGVSAGIGWAHFNGNVKQMIKHPTDPVIYGIFNGSNTVASMSLETGDVHTVTLDQPVRLYVSGGKLYVALVNGIAILKADTLEKVEEFNTTIHPFDLVVDDNGYMYVSSGWDQWTYINSYAPTNVFVEQTGVRQSSYLQYSPHHVYSIDTDLSPRDIRAYNVDDTGHFTDPKYPGGYDSPYHGDYNMSTYLQITPDYKYLFNGAGTIFTSSTTKADDMRYVRTIEPFSRVVFSKDLTTFYTLNGSTLNVYDYATFQRKQQLAMPTTIVDILPGDKQDELLIAYSEGGQTTLSPYSLVPSVVSGLSKPSITGQSVAQAASSLVNGCPIPPNSPDPSENNGSDNSGGGFGGGFFGGFFPAEPVDPSVKLGPDDMKTTTDSSGMHFELESADLRAALFKAQEQADAQAKQEDEPVVPKVIISLEQLEVNLSVAFPSSVLLEASKKYSDMILVVQSHDVTYELPVKAFLDTGSTVITDDMTVDISIAKSSNLIRNKITKQLTQEGFKPLSDSIAFTVMLEKDGKSTEWNDFNGTYVTRSFTIKANADMNHLTALVYDSETGTSGFVPAFARKEGDHTVMEVKVPHNSTYTVASASKTFTDITGHWAQKDIEIMASKRVVLGATATTFNPDQQVTRAEFAALLVRALGLASPQTSSLRFTDVQPNAWYARVASVADQTGLIKGDTNGRFSPNGIITKQEMAVMIGRAMKYVTVKPETGSANTAISVDKLPDAASIAAWATEDINQLLKAGILEVELKGKFEPALSVTRANAVVALKRMLQQLAFINE
nr:M4 family metallopeptidase [Paenibacillus lignilyticus]